MHIFEIRIADSLWIPMNETAKDGRIIFISDNIGHVDLARWEKSGWSEDLATWAHEGWSSEFGVCDEPTHFSRLAIV